MKYREFNTRICSRLTPLTPQTHYFSCFPVGLWMQPEPLEVEPHQMHLLAPGPWRCLRVGEWIQPDP